MRIGATVTLDELARERRDPPDVSGAVRMRRVGVSSPQIRNMGTVGGDLCQRPRCWYYRNGFGLLGKDKDGKSLIPGGENKFHAIFGNGGPAYFVSASSLGPALMALGAKIRLVSPSGTPGRRCGEVLSSRRRTADSREIALLPNELVTEIRAPGRATPGTPPMRCGRKKRSTGRWPPLRCR